MLISLRSNNFIDFNNNLTFFSEPEVKILEYQTQQYKILPQIAIVFAQWFSAHATRRTYNTVQEEIAKGNLNLLPEVGTILCLFIRSSFIFTAPRSERIQIRL